MVCKKNCYSLQDDSLQENQLQDTNVKSFQDDSLQE